jgi:hypothetical protein
MRYAFDLAVATVGYQEMVRLDQERRGTELPLPAGKPFDVRDYKSATDEEIDANLRTLTTDEQFGGSIEVGPVSE